MLADVEVDVAALTLADAAAAGVALVAAAGVVLDVDVAADGLALGDVIAFAPFALRPFRPCPFAPGAAFSVAVAEVVELTLALALGSAVASALRAFFPALPWRAPGVVLVPASPETFVSVLVELAAFGVVSELCVFAAARSPFAPCCFAPGAVVVAVPSVAVLALAAGFASAAFAFSAACLLPVGVDDASGCCAIAAPASVSDTPISKLVNFFILVSLVVNLRASIQARRAFRPIVHRSPNDTSRKRLRSVVFLALISHARDFCPLRSLSSDL